ncbi:MAG: hypothetical protein WB297_08490 [Actinomycetota bacterium]
MRAVLLIPLVVAFILTVLNLVTRRYDNEEQPKGQGRTILDALIDLLSWR